MQQCLGTTGSYCIVTNIQVCDILSFETFSDVLDRLWDLVTLSGNEGIVKV